jgi:hypothetical protein
MDNKFESINNSSTTISRPSNISGNITSKSNTRLKSKSEGKSKLKSKVKSKLYKLIPKFKNPNARYNCKHYKIKILGQTNKSLYEACKRNKTCRINKCGNIDARLQSTIAKKLGADGNVLLLNSITSKCPLDMPNKSRKRCFNKATKKFYEENGMGDIYNEVLECDKKTCAKERHNFHATLFHANKTKKRVRSPALVNIEDIPDQQMIEMN